MSLERLEGKQYQSNSDIWSLGIIIYEMVLGEYPLGDIRNKTILDLIEILKQQHYLKFPKTFSPPFVDFLRKCLKKDYKERAKSYDLLSHPFIKKVSKIKKDIFQK